MMVGQGQGAGDVAGWGGGGMRWAQRVGPGWSFGGNSEELDVYSKCRRKLWVG